MRLNPRASWTDGVTLGGSGPTSRGFRFHFLDAMRGIAALWVVLFHMLEGGHLSTLAAVVPHAALAPLSYGYLGVPIFFVISGFVIAHSVGLERVTAGFIGRFAARRSMRLDPPYWASMVLFVTMQALSFRFVVGKQASYPDAPTVIAHLAYLQGVLNKPSINIVYWTLCLEVQFYLIYILLLGIVQRMAGAQPRSTITTLAVATAAASLPGVFGLIPPGAVTVWFPGLWYGFLLGMWTYWTYRGLLSPRLWAGYVAIVAIAGVLRGDALTITTSATAVAFHILARSHRSQRRLGELRWLQHLGRVSYSLYLIHNPITGAFFNVAYRLTGRSLLTEVLWFCPAILFNVLAASVFWYFIERPSAQLSSRLFSGAAAPARVAQGDAVNA